MERETTYTIKTEDFEGPLDLLLSLIEKRKMHINDVALATVTDEFIAYIESQDTFPMSQAAHFIYVAATLLLIKSKSLLPTLELTEDEAGDIAELEERLRIYTQIQPLVAHIRSAHAGAKLYGKRPTQKAPIFAPDTHTESAAMHAAIHDVVQNLPTLPTKEQSVSVKEIISVEEMIDQLAVRVQRELSVNFNALAKGGGGDRSSVVTSFLALLELIKRGAVAVRQTEQFGDIAIEAQDVSVPDYGA